MALQKAIELLGGPAAAARIFGVSAEAVRKWVRRNQVPPERVLAMEEATGSRVTRYELRPDIYGSAPRALPPETDQARAAG